jgi:Protein of unknown function (DUF1003)
LQRRRQSEEREATIEERVAELITRFTGSMRLVYLHVALFGFWVAANLGWVPGVPAWDPSFVVLAMVASVAAIFLSTFVLISQKPYGCGGRQAGGPRPADQPARGARGHRTGHDGIRNCRSDRGQD